MYVDKPMRGHGLMQAIAHQGLRHEHRQICNDFGSKNAVRRAFGSGGFSFVPAKDGSKVGFAGAIAVALMSPLSVGPQKFYLEENSAILSPALVIGSAFIAVVFVCAVKELRTASASN